MKIENIENRTWKNKNVKMENLKSYSSFNENNLTSEIDFEQINNSLNDPKIMKVVEKIFNNLNPKLKSKISDYVLNTDVLDISKMEKHVGKYNLIEISKNADSVENLVDEIENIEKNESFLSGFVGIVMFLCFAWFTGLALWGAGAGIAVMFNFIKRYYSNIRERLGDAFIGFILFIFCALVSILTSTVMISSFKTGIGKNPNFEVGFPLSKIIKVTNSKETVYIKMTKDPKTGELKVEKK